MTKPKSKDQLKAYRGKQSYLTELNVILRSKHMVEATNSRSYILSGRR